MKPLPEKWTFPYMFLENENTYHKQCLVKINRPSKSCQEARKENPWHDLHEATTFSCERQYGRNKDTPAHRSSLDYGLKSTYDHTKEWPTEPEDTVVQPETKDFTRGYRECRPSKPPEVRPKMFNHPLFVSPVTEKANNINNIGLAIECPHISQTNNGYSRKKESGTFYRS